MKSLCLRSDFPPLAGWSPGLPRTVYLDSAATSLTPTPVIDATREYYETSSANIHRGKHILSDLASEAYEACRFAVADFLRVQHAEVVLTRNTTHGLNILAHGLNLGVSDRVLVVGDGHHSVLLPWINRCRVERIQVDRDGRPSLEAYLAALPSGGVRAVVLSHCSNVTGFYLDLDPWVRAAKDAGALVLLDAAQSAPHRPLYPHELGVDAVAFSGHKMLGPTGMGVLWCRAELLEELIPLEIGGGTVDWVDDEGFRWRAAPHRFEAGTPDIAAAYAMHAAIRYLTALDMRMVAEHDRQLAALLTASAAEHGFQWIGMDSPAARGAILSLFWPGAAPGSLDVLARALSDSYGVMCRTGYLCAQPLVTKLSGGPVLRMSAYVYNDAEDVAAAFAAIDELSASGVFRHA